MHSTLRTDRYVDDPLLDPGDDEIDEWTLDDLEHSADLVSIQAASARRDDWAGMGHD